MIRLTLVIAFTLILFALIVSRKFARFTYRHILVPLRLWLVPSAKVLVRRVRQSTR